MRSHRELCSKLRFRSELRGQRLACHCVGREVCDDGGERLPDACLPCYGHSLAAAANCTPRQLAQIAEAIHAQRAPTDQGSCFNVNLLLRHTVSTLSSGVVNLSQHLILELLRRMRLTTLFDRLNTFLASCLPGHVF